VPAGNNPEKNAAVRGLGARLLEEGRDYDESVAVAERLVRDGGAGYVSVASKAARPGKIFVDWLRNSRGATAVAPWSVRARAGAPVSMPVRWEELGDLEGGGAFDVPAALTRARKRALDPWASMLSCRQRLSRAVAAKLD